MTMNKSNINFVVVPVIAMLCFMLWPGAARADQADSEAKVGEDDFKKNVVYQVITDRFCNGRKDNDDPEKSPGLFDGSRKNWHAYWGGDLKGIETKLDYIRELGARAIWISPVVDNQNKPVNDDKGAMTAPYHGYHARDFKRIDEHFGDNQNSFADFDSLVKSAHDRGIKVLVDMPFNHTSQYNHGEFGALYDDGQFKGDPEYDRNKYFHHLPLVKDWNDAYQIQYGTIFYLGDLNQSNDFVDRYLKAAAEKLLRHGADATRIDAAKHTNWGWQHSLANHLFNIDNHLVVAEWWLGEGVDDPIFRDAVKYCRQSGITMFDFPFASAVRKLYSQNGDFRDLARTIEREDDLFDDPCSLFTFIDNHDMPRFLSIKNDTSALHQALALLVMTRGIPVVYYGTEQYLHDDTRGGEDPYTRVWMSSFDQSSAGYDLIRKLIALRDSNPALYYGAQRKLYADRDVYIFERSFGENVAVIAVNKGKEKSVLDLSGSFLKEGDYEDALGGTLSGVSASMKGDGKASLSLPPDSVSIWSRTEPAKKPLVATVSPRVVTAGNPVTVTGLGFGTERGKIRVGNETLAPSSWSDTAVTFRAPHLVTGRQELVLQRADGETSRQPSPLTVREGKLVPVTFRVEGAILKSPEERLFITGNVSTLGAWSEDPGEAQGPLLLSEDRDYILCVPVPASKKIEFKIVVLDGRGGKVREESRGHIYKVPDSGAWEHSVTFRE
ncbi:MAG: IPT/TIG domain-containing protein [Cyanobacteria bacterium HKST-UBA02]|nr:IPT/TIG domain-containing protein [Cyanobacteria bacterium HKST-UBA02]